MNLVFLGMGKMGLPLARHLQAAGYAVTVHDPDIHRVRLARDAGLRVSENLAADLKLASMVLSSLPHDDALRAVGRQVCEGTPAGVALVDTSTVSMQASAEVSQLCADTNHPYLRITVSGNNHMAEAAQLTMMASGPQATYQEALPLLKCWGPNQFYLGEDEQARLMKLVVNLMIVQTSAMLSEALALGRKGGLDWESMWQVIAASAVASPIVKAKSLQLGQPLLVRDFTPTFTVHQMLKDLELILGAGKSLHVPLAQTAMTQQWMQSAIAQGDGQQDYATIIKVLERASGLNP